MKKLKLSLQNMEGVEVLSREQLKKVMGGSGGSGEGGGSGGDIYCCDVSGTNPNRRCPGNLTCSSTQPCTLNRSEGLCV